MAGSLLDEISAVAPPKPELMDFISAWTQAGPCQSVWSQVTFLMVQIKFYLFFYLKVRCYPLVYFVIQRYIKLV